TPPSLPNASITSLCKQITRHLVPQLTPIRLDIEGAKLYHLDLGCRHRRAHDDRLPGKIDVRDQCQAETMIASVRHPTQQMALEACWQHPRPARGCLVLRSDGQQPFARVLGVEKTRMLLFPARKQERPLKNHLAECELNCGRGSEIPPKSP